MFIIVSYIESVYGFNWSGWKLPELEKYISTHMKRCKQMIIR